MPQAFRDPHLPVGRLYLIAVWGAVETRQLSQFHLKAALTKGGSHQNQADIDFLLMDQQLPLGFTPEPN
jgi:hypothetical protein